MYCSETECINRFISPHPRHPALDAEDRLEHCLARPRLEHVDLLGRRCGSDAGYGSYGGCCSRYHLVFHLRCGGAGCSVALGWLGTVDLAVGSHAFAVALGPVSLHHRKLRKMTYSAVEHAARK